MDINKNIDNITIRIKEIEDEKNRLSGMLEVMNTLKSMGVNMVNPENLKDTNTNEVIDEEPVSNDE